LASEKHYLRTPEGKKSKWKREGLQKFSACWKVGSDIQEGQCREKKLDARKEKMNLARGGD